MNFRTRDGVIIENVSEYVSEWLNQHPESEVYIGCDSQEVGTNVNYVTTICLYEFGRGAHVIHRKEIEPRPKKGDPVANMHPKLRKRSALRTDAEIGREETKISRSSNVN